MIALLEIALFAASIAAILSVFASTLLPALPRIIALLATGRDPAWATSSSLPVARARRGRPVRTLVQDPVLLRAAA